MICWILTDDKAGTRHQCIGLAARLGEDLEPRLFTSRPRWPWSWLPARTWPWPLRSQAAGGAALLAPWPDLLIVAGRGAVALGPAIKKAHGGGACLVAVQNPRLPLAAFDLVIAPAHDGVQAPNLLTIQGALTGVTPATLAKGRDDFPALADIPSPRVAVLIGGGNRHFRLGAAEAKRIGRQLRALTEQGASLLVTTSRRTSLAASNALRAALGDEAALFWDGRLDDPGNPYQGILGWADHFLVTPDSISMACEAACCGRPVQILDLPRLRACGKFARFHQHMRERRHCRPFTGQLESWPVPPFDETGRAAAAIQTLLKTAKRQLPVTP